MRLEVAWRISPRLARRLRFFLPIGFDLGKPSSAKMPIVTGIQPETRTGIGSTFQEAGATKSSETSHPGRKFSRHRS